MVEAFYLVHLYWEVTDKPQSLLPLHLFRSGILRRLALKSSCLNLHAEISEVCHHGKSHVCGALFDASIPLAVPKHKGLQYMDKCPCLVLKGC